LPDRYPIALEGEEHIICRDIGIQKRNTPHFVKKQQQGGGLGQEKGEFGLKEEGGRTSGGGL